MMIIFTILCKKQSYDLSLNYIVRIIMQDILIL